MVNPKIKLYFFINLVFFRAMRNEVITGKNSATNNGKNVLLPIAIIKENRRNIVNIR